MNEEVTTQENLELVREAAMSGVHQAQVLFGQMLLDGRLVERNPTWALHWFERAAQSGDVMAMNMAGRCFDQGWGVARDAVMAEKWFRKAADRGLDWGMYNLATLLALGEGGVKQDKAQAFHWLLEAAKQGHVKSMNILGGFYEDGWIVKADREKAREYYRLAADGGDFRGHFNTGRLLLEDGNEEAAIACFRRVPETATQAFMAKMKLFLEQSASARIKSFAQELAASHTPTQAQDILVGA
ncbi:tetratricopeptide repeat protein [Granulicella cerasi]|uniref:Tetratricopeptide repeat protein n=1 Tax=Granulicella cerasi TaxID=741063 RepID=A0ABW1ZE05_9BACT|nr:tetratricopeptide repeat protein [Granulicella cerasi]